jgi:hypothetical protein
LDRRAAGSKDVKLVTRAELEALGISFVVDGTHVLFDMGSNQIVGASI